MKNEIRVASVTDIEALFEIRTSVHDNHQSRCELATVGITPDSIRQMLQDASRAWLGLEDGVPVAFSMANAEQATVFAMFVRPGHEDRGFGRRLMREAEAWLFSRECDEIWLLTSADPGIRAHGFYRHLGWQPAGIQKDGQVKFIKRRAGA
jgi:GNAT superfamily N-acetyltransferase